MFQESVTFKDVAVDITQEDWELMRPVQKELYKTVTLQNYWNMVSLGERLSVPPNHTHARVCLSSALKSGLGLEVNMLICSGTETANFCSLFPDERFQSERSSGTTMHGPPRPPPHALPSACLPHSLCTRILQGGGRFLSLLQKGSDLIHEIVSESFFSCKRSVLMGKKKSVNKSRMTVYLQGKTHFVPPGQDLQYIDQLWSPCWKNHGWY